VAVILQIKQEKKLKQSILNGGSRASGSEVSAGQQTFHVCIEPFVVIVAYCLHQRRRLFLGLCINCSVPENNFPECVNPHFVFLEYFIRDQICNPNHDCDLKY